MIVSDLSEQPCNKSDNINKVVTSCSQLVPNLLTTGDKQCEYNLLMACWQTCYKMLDLSVCTLNSSEQSCDRVLFHSISVPKIRSTPNSNWSRLLEECYFEGSTAIYRHTVIISFSNARLRKNNE